MKRIDILIFRIRISKWSLKLLFVCTVFYKKEKWTRLLRALGRAEQGMEIIDNKKGRVQNYGLPSAREGRKGDSWEERNLWKRKIGFLWNVSLRSAHLRQCSKTLDVTKSISIYLTKIYLSKSCFFRLKFISIIFWNCVNVIIVSPITINITYC